MHADTVDQLVSFPWRAVVLRHYVTPKIHALIAIPCVRNELLLRFAWCMTGLTMEEYDSEEKKVERRESALDGESKRPYDL